MSKITQPQMRKLYATAREMGIDNDLLHSMIQSRYRKKHVSSLTIKQAANLIDTISGRMIPLPTGRPLYLVTPGQLFKIRELEASLGWTDNPARLRGFLRKYSGTDNTEWLTKEQAWRVIEGMKALLARQENGGDGGGGELDKTSQSGSTP